MGASGWSYFEDYVEDVQVAFERLQRRVLESAEYVKPPASNTDRGLLVEEEAYMAEMLKEIEEALLYADHPQVRATLEKERGSLRLALGIEDDEDENSELEEWQKEVKRLRALSNTEGTHSILDLERVDTEMRPPKRVSGRVYDPSIVYQLDYGAGGQTTSGYSHGALRLLTEEELETYYGHAHPTREEIGEGGIGFDVPRWTGVVHPVYDAEGAPTHWYFEGISGD